VDAWLRRGLPLWQRWLSLPAQDGGPSRVDGNFQLTRNPGL
jgi:hypothetical protein